jgi:hypothetical protein
MNESNNNVIAMPIAQPAPVRFKVRCVLEGFEVEIEGEGKADSLKGLVDKLRAIGATPASKPAAAAEIQASAPKCNLHNRPMKPSKRPGSFYCSAKLADGSYCDQKIDA